MENTTTNASMSSRSLVDLVVRTPLVGEQLDGHLGLSEKQERAFTSLNSFSLRQEPDAVEQSSNYERIEILVPAHNSRRWALRVLHGLG